MYYEISIGMPEDSPASYEHIVLRGYGINSKFQYTTGYIPAKTWSEFQGTVNIYAVYSDQSQELILENQNIEHDIDFVIPPGAKEVILESSQDSFLVNRKYYHELTFYLFLKRRTDRVDVVRIPSSVIPTTANLH